MAGHDRVRPGLVELALHHQRLEVADGELTGPTPLLPDFTWGVWYTWYNSYTESRAKDEIGNWTAIKLPLDGESERVTPLPFLAFVC